MGVGSSLQNSRDYEPPPLPSPFGPGGHFQGLPRPSSASQESCGGNTPSQEPRTRDSLRNDESWHHCPSAPSFSNLRRRETLLTYATQMTGWQSEYAPSGHSVHQEAMELTRTVSHLAAANQQLAAAHTALLAQLEGLYLELNKEREVNAALQSEARKYDVGEELRQRIEVVEGVIEEKFACSGGRERPEDWRPVKKKEKSFGDGEYIRVEYQRAVERIKVLEGELRGHNARWREEERSRGTDAVALASEIERLKADQLEAREINKKLNGELDKLRRDYQKLESSREDRGLRDLNPEMGTAKSKIANVTQENDDESFRLRRRLSGELETRRKQDAALEEALKEIQRLNEIIATAKSVHTKKEEVSDAETSTEEDAAERPNLEEFKKDLCMKREARQRAIAAVSSEMDRLRRELDAEKEAHSETSRVLDLLKAQAEDACRKSETFSVGTTTTASEDWKISGDWPEPNLIQKDAQRLTDVLKVSDELRSCIRLQIEKIDDLRYHLECEPESNEHRIETLKEVARTNREAFEVREKQINRLKNILSQTVARLGDEKFKIEITEDLRTEHDRQVEDVRRLKNLYDERMRVLVDLKELTAKELSTTKQKFKCLMVEKESVDEDLKKAEEKLDVQDTEISNLESQLGLTKADCRDLQNQMSLINSLFSQMLLSASSADMDLDRLTQLLQENHDLISDMAREEGSEAAALPKLLLDLVEQVEGRERTKVTEGATEKKEDDIQEESIANNLPKVWKVLTELLSCHAASSTSTPASSTLLSSDPNSCYKSVDTPTGPRLVISVSKTYIRLKELILEKKHLEKEMGRMKQLNSHLESKLGEQEKRLSTVSAELSKTWNIVGRMQAQHQQLHTHEKILRYELQQKRKMLQELKQELEYCREKWESARQKNTNTEIEWKNLRREFAARKALAHDSFNNSAESGFSDDRCDDSDDEENPAEERLRTSPRRRTRKENPRAATPETESEQPTDTELSESKTESTSPEERTPTPETSESIPEGRQSPKDKAQETLNPLDRALANVINNLIRIESDDTANESSSSSVNCKQEETKINSGNDEEMSVTTACQHQHRENEQTTHENTKESQEERIETPNTISVFSIGPFPASPVGSAGKTVQFSDPLVIGPSAYAETSVFGPRSTLHDSETASDGNQITDDAVVSCNNEKNTHVDIKEPTRDADLLETKDNIKQENGEPNKEDNKDITEVNIKEHSEVVLNSNRSVLETPSTSTPRGNRTSEEVLAARDARLKRLEEQAEWLMRKMNATSRRGSALSTRLEELHEAYGEPPVPPPMPDVLPVIRLPTNPDLTDGTESTAEPSENHPPPQINP